MKRDDDNQYSSVVIGSGYGDEGKGLITDFEVRRLKAKNVCRFNGGSQAGHTVETTDGRRHVFGHLGAGTFAGADTYLSSTFIVNPLVFVKEFACESLGRDYPSINVHPEARVTTLFDMALNALVELKRGNSRNGSCGLGINETVTRHKLFPLSMADIKYFNGRALEYKLIDIRDNWVPKRLQQLDIIHQIGTTPLSELEIPEPYKSILINPDISKMAKDLIDASERLNLNIHNINPVGVFEGAQGLMLDEFLGDYPHVTRSITGLPSAIVAAKELGITNIRPIYVTRTYSTRHGAGPLIGVGVDTGCNIVDKTNLQNEWQGEMRFAPLNLKELSYFIKQDIARGSGVAQIFDINMDTPTLAVTCLDQCSNKVNVIGLNGSLVSVKKEMLISYISNALGMVVSHVSSGPTAADVKYFDMNLKQ